MGRIGHPYRLASSQKERPVGIFPIERQPTIGMDGISGIFSGADRVLQQLVFIHVRHDVIDRLIDHIQQLKKVQSLRLL